MKVSDTTDRLRQIMKDNGLNQVDILERCKPYCEKYGVRLGKNDLSQYVSGKVKAPKQDKLTILALALNVNECWLMGYEVPPERTESQEQSSKESNIFKTVQELYGKEAVDCLRLFIQLNPEDRWRIIGSIETLLNDKKYSTQDGSKIG